MRAYRMAEFNGPAGLLLTEEAIPNVGSRDALVRLHASSLNFRDGMIADGFFGPYVQRGIVPLSDGAGEVVAIGEAVTRVKIGDRVMPIFNQHWIGGKRPTDASPMGLGAESDGTLRDYMTVKEDGLVLIPEHLSFQEAAALPCAGLTAWAALVGREPLYPGETVLVQGSGGVSVFALQFAKLFGARVIATSSSEEKCARLRALGADETINYKSTPDWDKEVQGLTGGKGADVIVEVGGAGTLGRSFRSAHANTRISIVGLLSGATGGDGFDFMSWIATTYRTGVGSRQDFEQMNKAIAYHKLRPVLDRVFSLGEAPAAYEHFTAQRHFGKVIVNHE